MTQQTRRSLLGGIAGAAALGVSGVAAGQESTEAQPEGVVASLGSVDIASWDWQSNRNRFRIDFDSDSPERIKITDTGALMKAMTEGGGSGAFEIPTEGRTLESGASRIFFSAVRFEDVAAITVSSSEGAVLLRTDSIQVGRPAVEYGTAGLMAGTAAIGSGWLSFRRTRDKLQEDDEPEAERIA